MRETQDVEDFRPAGHVAQALGTHPANTRRLLDALAMASAARLLGRGKRCLLLWPW